MNAPKRQIEANSSPSSTIIEDYRGPLQVTSTTRSVIYAEPSLPARQGDEPIRPRNVFYATYRVLLHPLQRMLGLWVFVPLFIALAAFISPLYGWLNRFGGFALRQQWAQVDTVKIIPSGQQLVIGLLLIVTIAGLLHNMGNLLSIGKSPAPKWAFVQSLMWVLVWVFFVVLLLIWLENHPVEIDYHIYYSG